MGIEAKLDAKITLLKNKIQARQLRHAYMWWIGKCTLPLNPKFYFELYNQYKENLYSRVIYEKDKAIEADKSKRYSQQTTHKSSFAIEGDHDNSSKDKSNELSKYRYFVQSKQDQTKYNCNIFKSEISVIQREFEVLLIKEGIKLISKHDEALKGCLEMGAADNQINAFIHPYQQFASTLFETVDRNSHLDIVTKASFVQQFLTRLKNRCTEVETLTSGPGVVFSMKDFNDWIQTLWRGMIKYCETSIRSINETSLLKTQQLQHLVYINERNMQYYKDK